jgi:hypothetical protein
VRVWALALGAVGVAAGLLGAAPAKEPWTVIVSGDVNGYLSPCGCTSPMFGGIRRRATAIGKEETTLLLDTGGWVTGVGRQDVMKAETVAMALAASHVAAINLTPEEAAFGRGQMLSLVRLSREAIVSSHLLEGNELGVKRWISKGPFLIGGVSTRGQVVGRALELPVSSLEDAIESLVFEAAMQSKQPLLMLNGGREDALRIARQFPSLRLVSYRTVGDPGDSLDRVGDTALVTPGDRGRSIVRMQFGGDRFSDYARVVLGPDLHDDPDVERIYRTYLRRVDEAGLLEALPRRPGPEFAGTETCGSCHSDSHQVWQSSAHAKALATLEKEGHHRDPDCVSCHVVGLDHEAGFRSRLLTPQLADVGCESCHGPGAAHAASPHEVKLKPAGPESCAPCHTVGNSPNFDFLTYWRRIQH